MKTRAIILFTAHFLLLTSSPAQPPPLIHYQGRLVDGTNLVNASVSMAFRIYTNDVGGAHLYESTNLVTVVDGLYATDIGEYVTMGNLHSALLNPAVWLEVIVDGTPLAPRERLLAVPYARMVHGLRVDTDGAVALNPEAGFNVASAEQAAVGGGSGNTASNGFAVVGGGFFNTAGGGASTVGGGSGNDAIGHQSTVAGGLNNTAEGLRSTVAGGDGNIADASHSAVGGGISNLAGGEYSIVGGGQGNSATGAHSTVSGGWGNRALGLAATVGGGTNNLAGPDWTTVGGGRENVADAWYATIGGGQQNIASAAASTVGGGNQNQATGIEATVGGGHHNVASGNGATVGGGGTLFAENIASGNYATVPGGRDNLASGVDSFAAGRGARATNVGAFVWNHATGGIIASTNDNSVTMRAAGGYRFFSNSGATLGAQLPPNATAWAAISDRDVKENIEPIDASVILERLAALPITAWTYKADPDHRRYIGPMAQDFRAAFGLGDDKTISTLDSDGVAFAAIQGLNAKVDGRVAELEAENARLRAELESIKHHLGL